MTTYKITDNITGEHIVTGDAIDVEEALTSEFSQALSEGHDDVARAIKTWRLPESADFLGIKIR